MCIVCWMFSTQHSSTAQIPGKQQPSMCVLCLQNVSRCCWAGRSCAVELRISLLTLKLLKQWYIEGPELLNILSLVTAIYSYSLAASCGKIGCIKLWSNWPWHCWLGGRKGIQPVKNWVAGCLSVWGNVQICIWPSWCHCHSLSLASVKFRLVLPFWYRLTRVIPDEGPLNGCCSWFNFGLCFCCL